MDPIDIAFPNVNFEKLQLDSVTTYPTINIDERGFVNLARELFKSLECRLDDTRMFCSELEFVYYSVTMLRTQQFMRYVGNSWPYGFPEMIDFIKWMEGRRYPAIFDPYFDCLGTTNMDFNIQYGMCREHKDVEGRQPSTSPYVSLSNLNKLLEVQDNDTLYKKAMTKLYAGDDVDFNSISGYRDKSSRPIVYRSDDKHMPKPFQFINLEAIRNVGRFMSSLDNKIKISTMKNGIESRTNIYPEVALIKVGKPDSCDLSSRFQFKGKPLLLAALFRLYTDAAEEERPVLLRHHQCFSYTLRNPESILLEKYVNSAFI